MARNYNLTIGELDTGKVLYELINISYQRGLRLPAELTLLAKTLFNLDNVTRSIDATYSPIPTIREFGNQIVAERAKRDLNPRRLYQLATEGSDLLMALPHRLDLITARHRQQRVRDEDQRSAVVADDSGAAEGREPRLFRASCSPACSSRAPCSCRTAARSAWPDSFSPARSACGWCWRSCGPTGTRSADEVGVIPTTKMSSRA